MNRTRISAWYSLIQTDSDVTACIGYILLADLILAFQAPESIALRSVIGIPVLLFIPGYVLLAALFPLAQQKGGERGRESPDRFTAIQGVLTSSQSPDNTSRLDLRARLALSFGLSLSLLPIVGLLFSLANITPDLVPLLGVLTILVLISGGIAFLRRSRSPKSERFEPNPWQTIIGSTREFFDTKTTVDTLLNISLVVAVLATTVTLGLGFTVPNQGETYTEVSLLSENESGSLVLSDYPRNFTAGESRQMTLEIHNEEGKSVNYSTVVQLQRVATVNNTTITGERQTITRLNNQIPTGETRRVKHKITPSMTGTDLKLSYLLYRDTPPARPSEESAYRTLHLWVNVSSR